MSLVLCERLRTKPFVHFREVAKRQLRSLRSESTIHLTPVFGKEFSFAAGAAVPPCLWCVARPFLFSVCPSLEAAGSPGRGLQQAIEHVTISRIVFCHGIPWLAAKHDPANSNFF